MLCCYFLCTTCSIYPSIHKEKRGKKNGKQICSPLFLQSHSSNKQTNKQNIGGPVFSIPVGNFQTKCIQKSIVIRSKCNFALRIAIVYLWCITRQLWHSSACVATTIATMNIVYLHRIYHFVLQYVFLSHF